MLATPTAGRINQIFNFLNLKTSLNIKRSSVVDLTFLVFRSPGGTDPMT